MSKKCEICGKESLKAASRSFSNKQNVKHQQPNLQSVRVDMGNGVVKTKKVCTSCLKKGLVKKAV